MARTVIETMPSQEVVPEGPGAPLYMDALLQPNRSLSSGAHTALIIIAAAIAVVLGLIYAVAGAWPVLGFFGLDIVLLIAAFRMSYKQGRLAERVRVGPDRMIVTRRYPTGRERHWSLAPHWAHVRIEDPVRHDSQVEVRSQGRTLVLGAFLSPPERGAFAAALRTALDEAKGPQFP